jgi:5-methylcytosine-specific restriction endonuclease McrA
MRFTKEDKKYIARARKQEVYEEDDWGNLYLVGYRCPICKRVFTSLDDLEVDHIYPRSRGGVDRPRNLRLLCTKDNRLKGSKLRRKSSTVKRKVSTVKRKSTAAKRKRR